MPIQINQNSKLFHAIASLIDKTKQKAAVFINRELVLLYWNVGNLVRKNILNYKRSEYGEQIIRTLSEKLTEFYGKGWGEKHINHCLHIAETFSKEKILYAVRRQLSWTHLRSIMYLKDKLQKEFYLQLCANKSEEHIELLALNKGNIRVAQYMTELPPKKLLMQKLHSALLIAQKQMEK